MDIVELQNWVENHRKELKPPIGNKVFMENDQLLVMAVGGPNNRFDFHYNETTEFFYQLEGTLQLDIQKAGALKTLYIPPGSMYLLAPGVPHRPIRPAQSIGVVIELKRFNNLKDGLQWYCSNCNHLLHEDYFKLSNIETDFQSRFQTFYGSTELRTCSQCATIHPKP